MPLQAYVERTRLRACRTQPIKRSERSCISSFYYFWARLSTHDRELNHGPRFILALDSAGECCRAVIFDVLRASRPEFHKKLVMVKGDCSLPKLGLSNSDYEILIQQVNIIFHLAATVKFDEKFNIAIPINVGGTKEIIDLCRACVKLKSMVYISTAYSNCHLKEIRECFYDPPFDMDEDIINYLCTADEATIELLKPKILDKWPNTYTFTKSIAENITKKNCC
uniref:Fatty acyl-CoA reductase n=1 Tax=Timema bartmani TaxID=61472 RepID=A0A7R9I6J7_9NEOP|nr:unnamed protein product [Timema bartmani]